jgi:hypothetical protein
MEHTKRKMLGAGEAAMNTIRQMIVEHPLFQQGLAKGALDETHPLNLSNWDNFDQFEQLLLG